MVFKSIPCLSRTPNALKSDIIKHLSHHGPDGYIKYITDEIVKAIGDEKYEVRVCCLNVNHSCEIIEYSLQIQKEEKEYGLKVLRAIYHLESGEIDFLRKSSKLSATTSVALYASLLKREKAVHEPLREKLNSYISENNVTKEKLLNDYSLQWLVTKPLYNIGEHVYKISDEYKELHPDIPWLMIAGLRHRLVHDYDGTNWNIIAEVVFTDLPELTKKIKSLLEKTQSTSKEKADC